MLQRMHDKIQGLVAWVFAVLIALTFALWGVQNYLHGGGTQAVAKVNGEKITQDQFRMAYEQAKHSEMLRFGASFSLDQKHQAELKKDVLQHLIKQKVIFQAETKMGLDVSQRQLWSLIASQPVFQSQGRFSLSNFQQIVQRLFPSEQVFFDNMKSGVLHTQFERGVVESAFVLPNEVEAIKKIDKQRRDFGYFIISTERFVDKIKLDSVIIKKYYDEHHSDFLLPEKISIQYLELSTGDLQNKSKPTEEQLRQFYQSRVDSFSPPKKWQVMKVLFPLAPKADAKAIDNAKKKMEEAAVLLKSKKELANIGSEIRTSTSWVMRNEVSPEIAAQLDKLKVDQVSSTYRTKDGYYLLKVLAKQENVTSYEAVAAKVKAAYDHQQVTQAFSEASDRLADLVYTNSDSLEPAAKELGLKLKETGMITRVGNKEGILANPKIVNAAFSDVVLKQRYNSNLIEVAPGKVVVLRIKDYVP